MSAWERNWQMAVGPLGIEGAEFELQKHPDSPVDIFTMKIKVCGNPDEWSRCKFVSFGSYFLPWGPTKLPPWDPKEKEIYEVAIEGWLKNVTAATARLEGEIAHLVEPEEQGEDDVTELIIAPASITMLVAKQSVQRGDGTLRDMLVLCARSKIFDKPIVVGGGDGTGHGTSNP
jgi:hypothetical protein